MLVFALNHYSSYLLILLRVVAFIAVSPILSVRAWPQVAKLGLAAFVALLVTPQVSQALPSPFSDPGDYMLLALQETTVGILLGLVASMMFSVIDIAGQLFDLQIGFAMANLLDPASGQTQSLTSSFLSVLFTLYFLGMNGLDGLVMAVLNSFKLIPVGQFHMPSNFEQVLLHILFLVMTMALQLAAPLVTALLLTNITFALLSRAVPQMNVFVVGLPVQLFVGLTLLAILMPAITYFFGTLFTNLFMQMNSLMQLVGV
ncbi:flagellar biosynthetic protein FliR [Alicyclobacillus tolerans]|uniref:flagellar biosynthetic protein FliR n=1 Tax=Alicyclobacillus tolerans TaxID=90970 RepID=UPI001F023DCE|nr:flagellar biosynthetic protein FliR [Alicyclobacillus tolerans]MCF8564769.1 flagellar biosynthetic protein FliR [Alicyclobacillus tolerans]